MLPGLHEKKIAGLSNGERLCLLHEQCFSRLTKYLRQLTDLRKPQPFRPHCGYGGQPFDTKFGGSKHRQIVATFARWHLPGHRETPICVLDPSLNATPLRSSVCPPRAKSKIIAVEYLPKSCRRKSADYHSATKTHHSTRQRWLRQSCLPLRPQPYPTKLTAKLPIRARLAGSGATLEAGALSWTCKLSMAMA